MADKIKLRSATMSASIAFNRSSLVGAMAVPCSTFELSCSVAGVQ